MAAVGGRKKTRRSVSYRNSPIGAIEQDYYERHLRVRPAKEEFFTEAIIDAKQEGRFVTTLLTAVLWRHDDWQLYYLEAPFRARAAVLRYERSSTFREVPIKLSELSALMYHAQSQYGAVNRVIDYLEKRFFSWSLVKEVGFVDAIPVDSPRTFLQSIREALAGTLRRTIEVYSLRVDFAETHHVRHKLAAECLAFTKEQMLPFAVPVPGGGGGDSESSSRPANDTPYLYRRHTSTESTKSGPSQKEKDGVSTPTTVAKPTSSMSLSTDSSLLNAETECSTVVSGTDIGPLDEAGEADFASSSVSGRDDGEVLVAQQEKHSSTSSGSSDTDNAALGLTVMDEFGRPRPPPLRKTHSNPEMKRIKVTVDPPAAKVIEHKRRQSLEMTHDLRRLLLVHSSANASNH